MLEISAIPIIALHVSKENKTDSCLPSRIEMMMGKRGLCIENN